MLSRLTPRLRILAAIGGGRIGVPIGRRLLSRVRARELLPKRPRWARALYCFLVR
jgi:hypothetical protein